MRRQLIYKRPVFAIYLGQSSANFLECRWLWRPPPVSNHDTQ